MIRADKLSKLSLSRDNIEADGCFHLAGAKWPSLSIIFLGDKILIKIKTLLENKDAVILRALTGILLNCVYVTNI